MKITIFGTVEFEAEADSWKLSRRKDFTRPSEMNIVFPRSVPIDDRCAIEAEEGGKIWFRGYVFSQSIKNKTQKTVKCYGVEDLLFRRRCPRYGLTRSFANYGSAWSGTWKAIYKLLESENPSLDGFGPRLGLLYLANSAVPEGLIEHYDDAHWTFKVAGFGTDFSANTPVTFNGRTLSAASTYADCYSTPDTYYRYATDLYFHPNATDFPDATKGILCIENASDTTIRLGEYSDILNDGNTQMANFQVDGETYGDLIKAVADWHGLDIAIRYEKDGYTYLDMVEDPGRWSDGSMELYEGDVADVQSKSAEIKPQVLFGLGYGGQDARQKITKVDYCAPGYWLHEEYEYEAGIVDADNPFPMLVEAEWARLLTQENIFEIELIRPIAADPYDYINLHLDYERPILLPIEQIDYGSDGVMTLSLGNRDVDILDMFNSRGEAQCYAKDQLRDGDPIWSTSGDVSVTPGSFLDTDGGISSWGTPGSVSVACSASYISGATRVILEISTEEEMYWNWVTLLKVTCNDVANDNTILRFYKTLDSSGGIDITDICPPGSTKTFKFYLIYTRPSIFTPNPVVLHYTVKYIYTDDVSAYAPPVTPGYTTVLLSDAETSSCGNPAVAYLVFNGLWGAPTPKDCTGLTKANGTLIIDLKTDEPGQLTSNGEIELTSSGGPGTNEWHVAVPYTSLTTAYQTFEIPLSSAGTTGGELNVAAINYLRWFNYGRGGNIHIEWRRASIKFPTPV